MYNVLFIILVLKNVLGKKIKPNARNNLSEDILAFKGKIKKWKKFRSIDV